MYIAPQCKEMIAEFKKFKYPEREPKEHTCSDHTQDLYLEELMLKYLKVLNNRERDRMLKAYQP